MRTSRPAQTLSRCLAGVLSGLLAGLVLTLALLAVSPDLHEPLHCREHHQAQTTAPGDDDGCVVHLFTNGVTTPLALISVAPPTVNWTGTLAIIRIRLYLSAPRYLHRPERGPPPIV